MSLWKCIHLDKTLHFFIFKELRAQKFFWFEFVSGPMSRKYKEARKKSRIFIFKMRNISGNFSMQENLSSCKQRWSQWVRNRYRDSARFCQRSRKLHYLATLPHTVDIKLLIGYNFYIFQSWLNEKIQKEAKCIIADKVTRVLAAWILSSLHFICIFIIHILISVFQVY